MLVTEIGIATLISPVQPLSALSPMLVTEFGIIILFNVVKLLKAYELIFLTLSFNTKSVHSTPLTNSFVDEEIGLESWS